MGEAQMMQLNRRSLLTNTVAVAGAAALAPVTATLPAVAAAPPVGKQNAGFYRYKVGSFEITVVTDGGNVGKLADAYVANADRAAVNAALEADFLQKDTVRGAFTPVVVNTGSKLVAIDTGLGLGMFAQSKGAVGQYHGNLKAAGIDVAQVDTVIISHYHGDHINGLVGADNKPMFPNAEIMVPAVEHAFWTDEANTSKAPEVARGQFGNVKRVMGALGNKVTRYEAGKELVPGITAIASPGHTPGHTSHMIASGNSKVLVQADITAGAASIFVRNPDWQFMFDTDKPQAVATRKKLYDMAAAEKVIVQGYHFAFPSAAYVEKSGNGYRLVPVPWNPTI
jgi:glyoxylase-like metal-dependent hydrolase (beta-lactamase superfamily II)